MLRALLERGIVPDVVIGTLGRGAQRRCDLLRPEPHRRRAARGRVGAAASRPRVPGRQDPPRVERRAPGHAPVRQRGTRGRHPPLLTGPLVLRSRDPAPGDRNRPRYRRGSRARRGGLLKPALLASAALPGVFPIVEHDGRRLVDGGVVNNVPLWHALSGPIDRVFVLNVSASPGDRPLRSPLDVVMTSFSHARSQRYELEMRFTPGDVQVIELPRPRDTRDLFDFSGAPRAHRRGVRPDVRRARSSRTRSRGRDPPRRRSNRRRAPPPIQTPPRSLSSPVISPAAAWRLVRSRGRRPAASRGTGSSSRRW